MWKYQIIKKRLSENQTLIDFHNKICDTKVRDFLYFSDYLEIQHWFDH